MLTTLELTVLRPLVFSSEGNGHDFGLWYAGTAAKIGVPMEQVRGVITSLQKKGLIEDWTAMTKADGAAPSVFAQYSLGESIIKLAEKVDCAIRNWAVDAGAYPERSSSDLLVDYIEKFGMEWNRKQFVDTFLD